MATKRIGRPQKPYHPSDGTDPIPGLYKRPDGRWKVLATGKVFSEPDERRAIARFRAMQPPPETVTLYRREADAHKIGADVARAGRNKLVMSIPADHTKEKPVLSRVIDGKDVWEFLREELINRPEYVAKMVGIPEIANLRHMQIPKAPIKLDRLVNLYEEKADSNWRTKGQARAAFKRLKKITDAETVEDLTTDKLIDFRQKVVESGLAPTGAAQVFNKIKSVFAFGLKYGLDSVQLTAALGRMKALYAPRSDSKNDPKPITREDFHKLLAAATPEWRAMLLLSLNCCLYIEDCCTLCWKDFDLTAGTYVGERSKTKVVRVGVLWPETVAALKALPRRGRSPFVFTSVTGTRINASSRYDTYRTLRIKAGVESPFSSIQDGGYTKKCDDRFSRVFACTGWPG